MVNWNDETEDSGADEKESDNEEVGSEGQPEEEEEEEENSRGEYFGHVID